MTNHQQTIIDLRSDTVTRPSEGMLTAMFAAKVGDDVFAEDPTVNELERKSAELFGMEAAIFCPSGTMTNQIALKVHTQPLEEIICHELSHIKHYEVGGHAFHSGATLKTVNGKDGMLSAADVHNNINPDYDWLPITKVVSLENTCNKAGGTCYQLLGIEAIKAACLEHNLKLHLDGARIFNALATSKNTPKEMGNLFDSISVCLSKGLGTPVGSVLLGKKTFIRQARRVRKVMGGGMRQAGYLAAAGIYALDHNIERLKEDHQRAKILGETLTELPYVKEVLPVPTNIILFELQPFLTAKNFVEQLATQNIITIPLPHNKIRLVTHLDFTDAMLDKTITVLKKHIWYS